MIDIHAMRLLNYTIVVVGEVLEGMVDDWEI